MFDDKDCGKFIRMHSESLEALDLDAGSFDVEEIMQGTGNGFPRLTELTLKCDYLRTEMLEGFFPLLSELDLTVWQKMDYSAGTCFPGVEVLYLRIPNVAKGKTSGNVAPLSFTDLASTFPNIRQFSLESKNTFPECLEDSVLYPLDTDWSLEYLRLINFKGLSGTFLLDGRFSCLRIVAFVSCPNILRDVLEQAKRENSSLACGEIRVYPGKTVGSGDYVV